MKKGSGTPFRKTVLMLGAALAVSAGGAQAQSFHTLYRFNSTDGRADIDQKRTPSQKTFRAYPKIC
jgi:hypothetical protein